MKLFRRNFLALLFGGAAGTVLSPIPWKLIDDMSIWTQMWPWVPVPKKGKKTFVDSVCTLCPGGCGITVKKVNDRAIKIDGMKNHPINNGGVCALSQAGLQLLYTPNRIKSPLKNIGKRGEGKWKKISWDEAVAEVAERLTEIKKYGNANAVAGISGTDKGTIPQLLHRLLSAYGSNNFIKMPSMQDSYELMLYLMQGVNANAAFDFDNSDFVLSFGSGIIDGWGSPVKMIKANSKWKEKKATVIQIENRLSNTAANANKWIAVNPGTETIFALGLCNVILNNSLYKKAFIENKTTGFDRWKYKVIKDYYPEKVSQLTGIDKSKIIEIAKAFAKAKHPIAISGRGQGRLPGSLHEFMAVNALNALVGNINNTGGVWAMPEPDYIKWDSVDIFTKRLDYAKSNRYPHSKYLLNQLINKINESDKPLVTAMLIEGANPLYSLTDTKNVKKAFDKIPFIVSFSSYMDETASNADLILPNHTYLERYQDVPFALGSHKPVIGLSKPVVKPIYNTQNVGDTYIQIAKTLEGRVARKFYWKDYKTCLKQTLGNKWNTLIKNCFWENKRFNISFQKSDQISSGKITFANYIFPNKNELAKLIGDKNKYPLTLISYESMRIAPGYIADPPYLMKTIEETVLKDNLSFAEINPKTALKYNLKENDLVKISTPIGKAKVKLHLFEGIMPGVVALPKGLGHTAYNSFISNKGINVNELLGQVEDPVSGYDASWGIRAKLSKV